jgi:hypothetical protein
LRRRARGQGRADVGGAARGRLLDGGRDRRHVARAQHADALAHLRDGRVVRNGADEALVGVGGLAPVLQVVLAAGDVEVEGGQRAHLARRGERLQRPGVVTDLITRLAGGELLARDVLVDIDEPGPVTRSAARAPS